MIAEIFASAGVQKAFRIMGTAFSRA